MYYDALRSKQVKLLIPESKVLEGYVTFITKFYKLLTDTLATYRVSTSLQTLITDYDALLATLPVYESTSSSSAVPPLLTGGYNKKNNQKKRKTNKRKTNKRKTNKRKTNKRKTNKRKTNKRKIKNK